MVDTIVIGAGPNGLTAAAALAKAGQSVLVLEAMDVVGGIAAPREFHPGFRNAGLLPDTTLVRPHVVAELGLTGHGVRMREAPPEVLALSDEGRTLRVGHELRGDVEAETQEHHADFTALMRRLAPVLRDVFDRPAIDIVGIESESLWGLAKRGLAVRRLGRADMMELLRLPVMPVADVLGEWFSDPLVSAALCLPALVGVHGGPWSPGTALNFMRHAALAGPGITGGGPMLVAALERAAREAGVEIRTGARVRSIDVDSGSVRGVTLADNERLEARRIVATCDPKTALLELLPVGTISHRTEHHVRTYRTRGTLAHVSFAIEDEVVLGGERVAHARTGGHVDAIERAWDATKYGELPDTPALELHVPTIDDATLAPAGHSVVTALVFFTPTEHAEGWTDATRDALGDRVQAVLARHCAGIENRIVAREVLTPPDLAEVYALPGGDVVHGEHSLDQLLVRPTPETIHYRSPVPGLWLGGSGTHPGGDLTCGPGWLAAKAILESAG